MEEVFNSPEEEATVLTPGVILASARLEKNLSQEEVAKKLKLSTQWVKDIENNDYTYASALIYAQGYLRSYARLLEIPAESVLAAFDASGLSSQFDKTRCKDKLRLQQSVVVSSGGRSWMHRKGRWARGVRLLMALSLALMVVAWWQGQNAHDRSDAQAEPVLSVQPQNLPLSNTPDN